MRLINLFFFLLVVAGRVTHGGHHVVFTEVSEGRLRGTMGRSAGGRMFHAYKGVPYARPPVGSLRWQPPHPPKPWLGVYSATRDRPACPQYVILTEIYVGEEDCLYLNVYTPPGAVNAPVIVWIHGGAFTAGSGRQDHYGPEVFLDLNVVLVTVTYRLGALGFLSTGDGFLPGNYGLKDQVAALQWVQRNAHAFGGDATRVTLMGQSSGGACVSLHLVSPQSRGLFTGAIVMSGSALSAWAIATDPAAVFDKVARLVGCGKSDGTDDNFPDSCAREEIFESEIEVNAEIQEQEGMDTEAKEEEAGMEHIIAEAEEQLDVAEKMGSENPGENEGMAREEVGKDRGDQRGDVEGGSAGRIPVTREEKLKCMYEVPARQLVQVLYKFSWWGLRMPVPFRPAVETQRCPAQAPFLPGPPEALLRQGRLNAVPVVTGVTSGEGLCVALATYVNPSLRRELRSRFRRVFDKNVMFGHWSQEDLAKLRHFYLGSGPPGTVPDLRLGTLTRLFSDATINMAQTRFARIWAHVSGKPVFFYVFSFEGRAAQVMQLGLYPGPYGVDHGDDLPYLFEDHSRPFPGGRDRRERVATRLWTSMMVNFARHSHPTPPKFARTPVIWRYIGPACSFRYMRFNDIPTMVEGLPFPEAVELWDYVEEHPSADRREGELDSDESEEAAELEAAMAEERAQAKALDEARRRTEEDRSPAIQRADEVAQAARLYERRRLALEKKRAELAAARVAALARMREQRVEALQRQVERKRLESQREERRRERMVRQLEREMLEEMNVEEQRRRQMEMEQQGEHHDLTTATKLLQEMGPFEAVEAERQRIADEAWERAKHDTELMAAEERCVMEGDEGELSEEELQQMAEQDEAQLRVMKAEDAAEAGAEGEEKKVAEKIEISEEDGKIKEAKEEEEAKGKISEKKSVTFAKNVTGDHLSSEYFKQKVKDETKDEGIPQKEHEHVVEDLDEETEKKMSVEDEKEEKDTKETLETQTKRKIMFTDNGTDDHTSSENFTHKAKYSIKGEGLPHKGHAHLDEDLKEDELEKTSDDVKGKGTDGEDGSSKTEEEVLNEKFPPSDDKKIAEETREEINAENPVEIAHVEEFLNKEGVKEVKVLKTTDERDTNQLNKTIENETEESGILIT